MPTRTMSPFHRSLALLPALLIASSVFPAPQPTASPEPAPTVQDGVSDPSTPITVGPRETVGQPGAGSRVVGGLLGGVLGGAGASKSADRPRTERDPTRKLDYRFVEDSANERVTAARAAWTDDGLLVSARIEDADDKSTFQAVFLQACDGRRLYPARHDIYRLWPESSVSVSWSRTTSVDGRVTGQSSGGWDDSLTDGFGMPGDELATTPGTWRQLGFDRAQGGARQLGSWFRLDPGTLAALGPLTLYVHTTLPRRDPVVTAASSWRLVRDAETGLELVPSNDDSLFGSEPCGEPPLLQAAAAGTAAAIGAPGSRGSDSSSGKPGFRTPAGVVLSRPRGTGQTTGHIADLTVRNDSPGDWTVPATTFYIPASGGYQAYVGRTPGGTPVPAGATVTLPITGYCADVRRPPVPAGEPMPPVEDWIHAGDPAIPVEIPPRDDAGPPGAATVPGTDTPLPRAVDPDREPEIAAPLLIAALEAIERATDDLQAGGELRTPFSGNPGRERDAVVQQVFWVFAGEMEGEPYTEAEFTERLEDQYEQNTGVPITAAAPEDRERVSQGAADFWDAFELVGTEAKVIADRDDLAAPAEGVAEGTPAAETVPPACDFVETFDHTPRTVHVVVSESYGNEDDRTAIRDGIRTAVEDNPDAYATSTPPSTAYALWGHDHIGGYSSAYAKSVFLEQNRQEWVWWTDPLTVRTQGRGTHTLAARHGPECSAVVAGSATQWIKASSEAFDPLERSIEHFRALDAVKEVTIEYLADKLPPGLDIALEEGVEAITDPSSDTFAGSSGTASLRVGGAQDGGNATNRVVYKREDKEDRAIIGGGANAVKLAASDVRPGSLTSVLEASAELTAGAKGNGFAKAYLESQYGTVLVGVCECPNGTVVQVATDSGLFIRSDVAGGVAKVVRDDLDDVAGRIADDILAGRQAADPEALEDRARSDLEAWARRHGGDRFENAAGAEAD